MRLAKVLGGVGRLLIWAGVIILLFVAYQLWGTNLAEARAQDDLEDDFRALVDETPAPDRTTSSTTAPSTSTTTSTTTTTTTTIPDADVPPPEPGEPIAQIRIPAIGVDKIVVEGIGRSDLRKGPGHYPQSPLPGQSGNAAIAGHRTTYGAPFHRVDELEPGDEIIVTTVQGEFFYEVAGQEIVSPSEVSVLEDKGDDRLTLTSCHPKYSARQRIIVTAMLTDPPAPPTERPEPDPEVAASPGSPADELQTIDGDERGPLAPVIVLGLVVLAVWLAFWFLSRKWRRWPSYALGVVPFGLALFVWFGAIAELLPTNF